MKHDIVAIGASAGGVEALRTILSSLPRDFPASIFITLHTMPTGPGYLAAVLAAVSALPVVTVKDEAEIKRGHAYVSSPNLHLIVRRGYVRSRFLPKENGTRPAIDPMFRSAAHAYAGRVIGVVLSGNLDDGTAGLGVIKDEGGLTVVQDPRSSAHQDMPLSAIKYVDPDYVVPLEEMAPLLIDLVGQEVTMSTPTDESDTEEQPDVMTCPGCGGVLRHYRDKQVSWYQCMVGHRYTAETMMLEQNRAVEEHFWRVLSALKEKEDAARTMASDARSSVNSLVDPEYFLQQAQASADVQERIKSLLDELGPRLFPPMPSKDAKQTEGSEQRDHRH